MSSVCARPVGSGCYFAGARGQRRARVRVAAAAAVAAPASKATMYEVLAVEETAGPAEIKAAYRREARRWHPDACPGGADRFMAAREAYEVLSDPERRRGYDIQLRCGGFGNAGYRAAWRAAERRGRETWVSRMRRAAAPQSM